jgi:very-short-patch-repair endonuclease
MRNYAVGHPASPPEGRWLAAVLACGDGAVLSHRSAASLWGIRIGEPHRPEVTTVHHRRHPGITTHRGRLAAADRTVHRGIPVTTPARALADISHVVADDDLRQAIRESQFLKLFDRAAIEDALTRRRSARLRAHLPALVTQSEMEDRFLLICRRHRLSLPERQHRIGARRYDFVWPAKRVVVETDGWRAHSGAYSFQADRSTTNALQLAGWLVLRFTWDDLTRRARKVAAAVRAALDRERPQS